MLILFLGLGLCEAADPGPIYVLVGVAFAILLVAWLIRKAITFKDDRALRRLTAKRCVKCNYDLRGSGITCPECGTTQPNPLEYQ